MMISGQEIYPLQICISKAQFLKKTQIHGCSRHDTRAFFYKDTPGWTTYLRNQARFYIRKYDGISGIGACRGCESCSLGTHHTHQHQVQQPVYLVVDSFLVYYQGRLQYTVLVKSYLLRRNRIHADFRRDCFVRLRVATLTTLDQIYCLHITK